MRYINRMKGRPPLPTELKLLRGTLRRGRVNTSEPAPPCLAADTIPPRWLSRAGKAVWREFLPQVCAWVAVTDVEIFGRFCALVADFRALRADIDRHGMTMQRISPKGVPLGSAKRPEVEMIRQVEKELRSVETLLGFNPSARSKVKTVEKTSPKDQLEQKLFG